MVKLRHFHTATYGSSTAGVRTKCMFSMLFSKCRNILLMPSAEGIQYSYWKMTTRFFLSFCMGPNTPIPTSADTITKALYQICFITTYWTAKSGHASLLQSKKKLGGEGEAVRDYLTANSKCSLSIFPAKSYSYVKILFLEWWLRRWRT